jgi:uncharacterized membrane protein
VTVALVLGLLVALPVWLRSVQRNDRMTVLEVLAFGVTVGSSFGLLGVVLS